MVFYLNLALVLFSLVAAAPIEERAEDAWIPGTEVNSPDIGYLGPSSRAGVNYEKALSDPLRQPELPINGRCSYTYKPVANLKPINTAAPYVLDTNVYQGGLGDCGMGAAVASIALRGMSKILYDNFRVVDDTTFEFTFYDNGAPVKVLVDNQLPTATATSIGCAPYLGYQIAPKGATSVTNAYVPLVEKAIAKFMDARVDRGERRGYPGMEGIAGERVMAILTGGKGTRHSRTVPGLDPLIVKNLHGCLSGSTPCVLASPGTDFAILGDEKNGTSFIVPPHYEYDAASLFKAQSPYYQVTDFDYNNAVNLIVGAHAWGLDVDGSKYDPNDIRNSVVRIVNPWGKNVEPWADTDKPNSIDMSFSALASIFRAVMVIEGIPQ